MTIDTVIIPRIRDLGGGFQVRRALPSGQRRAVGPFVFFDQMGPVMLRGGKALDVRPHPHIGLATVTYLFDGEILHRDSLGTVQSIRPGAVNWMTAGRGIVHSERTPPELRAAEAASRLFGLQIWVGLPTNREEAAPAFTHHGADALPVVAGEGKRVRLILGSLYGARAPVELFSDMFYADAELAPGARLDFPAEHAERALYVAEGRVEIGDVSVAAGQMPVLAAGAAAVIAAAEPTRLLLFGGEPLDGPPRHLWWNFVASSTERIEQAKADWKEGRFPTVPGDPEFIPLPDEPPPVRHP